MASGNNGSDSDESNSKAPERFRVSSSNEGCDEESQSNSNRRLRCPQCETLQQRFTCRSCVRKGDFIHSSKRFQESLAEKRQKYAQIQANLSVCRTRAEHLLKDRKVAESMEFEIKKKKQRIAILEKLISDKGVDIDEKTKERDELKAANAEKSKHLPKYPIKVKKLEDYVLDRTEKINKLREKNNELLEVVKKKTSDAIHKTVEFIFPISEVVLKDEVRDRAIARNQGAGPSTSTAEENDTIAALADAKNTSYIRGKWVFHGSGISEMQYRIVAPSLPANGDYAAYSDWLTENKDDVPKSDSIEISPSRVPAYRITGALTYSTQLLNLMSFYTNVRLPTKLSYGDFCKNLTDDHFSRKVNRLNSNILYLAYTQNVKLRFLNKDHTLENIIAILDSEKSELGRYGPNEVTHAPMIKSVDSLLVGIETGTESESEDENSLRLDWESVSNLPAPEIAPPNPLPPSQQTTSMAEGLMTSAANRLASILRWEDE